MKIREMMLILLTQSIQHLRPFLVCNPLPPLIPNRQKRIIRNTPAQQSNNHIPQHNTMSQSVPRRILSAVNIRRHYTVEISPRDHRAEGYAAFVHALDVVGNPGYGVGNTGVDTNCAEEGAGVGDVRITGCD